MAADARASTDAVRGAYAGRPSPLVPAPGPVALSVALAGLTFAVVPFFGMLSEAGHSRLEVRAVDTASLPQPPPVAKIEAREPKRERPRPKLQAKPKPEERRQRVQALRAQIGLSMSSITPGPGDFSLDFGIRPVVPAGLEDEAPLVFDLAEIDSPPRPLVQIRPLYPFRARELGLEGFVELLFVVASDGSVRDAEILRSEPEDVFDRTSEAAVRRWRFTPGTRHGEPVATRVRMTIRFRLDER